MQRGQCPIYNVVPLKALYPYFGNFKMEIFVFSAEVNCEFAAYKKEWRNSEK